MMDLGLRGKSAIVCASSRGLGRGCAEALAEAGCDLVINGRDKDALEATRAYLTDTFQVKVSVIAADVSTPEGQTAL
jgi:3-oxoacyl-[acyl-carrier protein] reductase